MTDFAPGPRVTTVAGAAAAPTQKRPVVRINGLLVPDGLAPAVDDGQEAQVCCLLRKGQSLALCIPANPDDTTHNAANRRMSWGSAAFEVVHANHTGHGIRAAWLRMSPN
jgi:hypothetical protein